jgi:8-oxo-dGTP pyrophosphatase MutT (NUDIX family)
VQLGALVSASRAALMRRRFAHAAKSRACGKNKVVMVPGGGIHEGESAEDAVLRELAEESGVEAAVLVRKLGEAWGRSEPGNVPAGLEEHVQHAFHLRLNRLPPDEEWQWQEKSGGEVVEHRFAFRWAPLDEAATILWPHQAMWIESVRTSLRHV